MSHGIDPPSYREGDPLPECRYCRERSVSDLTGRCLNPECPSHGACEACGEREAAVILLGRGPSEDRLCLACAQPAIRAMLTQEQP